MSQPCRGRGHRDYLVRVSRLAGFLLALGAVPGLGVAAEVKRGARSRASAAAQAEAAQLLASGQQALTARDFAAAERAFTDSYLKVPAPQPLYFLGLCAAQQGRTLEAQDYLRRFEADPAAEPDESALSRLRRILAEPTPPHGRVQLLGEPGAIVRLDGRLVGALPLLAPALVSAEVPHTMTLEARGQSIPATVTVPTGRFVEVRINTASRGALITLLPAYIALTRYQGQSSKEIEEGVARSIEEGLAGEKKSMLGSKLALARAPDLARCLDKPECQQKLAEKNDAEGVFQIEIEPSPTTPGRYRARVKLLDTGTGDVASETAGGAEGSRDYDGAQLASALRQEVARAAVQAALRPRGTLKVLTEPPGAEVYVDERLIGRAPLERVVWAGRHELSLRKKGHDDVRRPVELSDGQIVNVKETLPEREVEPNPVLVTQIVERPPRPIWRLVLGGVGIGAGLVLGGVGLSGLATHGLCVSPGVEPDCMTRYNTRGPGGALTFLGGVLLVGGGLTAGLPSRPRRIDLFSVQPEAPEGTRPR
jgi:hypothetical protein